MVLLLVQVLVAALRDYGTSKPSVERAAYTIGVLIATQELQAAAVQGGAAAALVKCMLTFKVL